MTCFAATIRPEDVSSRAFARAVLARAEQKHAETLCWPDRRDELEDAAFAMSYARRALALFDIEENGIEPATPPTAAEKPRAEALRKHFTELRARCVAGGLGDRFRGVINAAYANLVVQLDGCDSTFPTNPLVRGAAFVAAAQELVDEMDAATCHVWGRQH